jgi:hypothetical protein
MQEIKYTIEEKFFSDKPSETFLKINNPKLNPLDSKLRPLGIREIKINYIPLVNTIKGMIKEIDQLSKINKSLIISEMRLKNELEYLKEELKSANNCIKGAL